MLELGSLLVKINTYAQTFKSIKKWAVAAPAPDDYRIVIHGYRKPTEQHIKRFNAPQASEVAAIVPVIEDGEVGRRDIVLRRSGTLNSNGNEVLSKVSVGHR